MVVCGARLYGFTDLVPGLFYVKTKFIHLMYFPLYPIAKPISSSKNQNSEMVAVVDHVDLFRSKSLQASNHSA